MNLGIQLTFTALQSCLGHLALSTVVCNFVMTKIKSIDVKSHHGPCVNIYAIGHEKELFPFSCILFVLYSSIWHI